MKRLAFPLVLSCLLAALLVGCRSSPTPTRPVEVDMQQFMAEYVQLGTPGEEHRELARMVGSWKTTMRYRDEPGGEWQTMEGAATYEPLFGGRFVIGREKGAFEMEGQKIEHESMVIFGFDKLRREWTSRYYSSMSTWSGELRGKKNARGEIEYAGLHVDNLTPQGRPARAVLRWEGEDRMVFDMWDSIGGEMVHTMRWIAERVR